MNTKILNYLVENLKDSFKLDKYGSVRNSISADTVIDKLPWTPGRFQKFLSQVQKTFDVEIDMHVLMKTVRDLSDHLDELYSARFWGGGVWQPRTDVYQYTGWNIVDEINKQNPRAVLDVGCGYNQFKPRIKNLVGIDKFNNSADYMVDILEYNVEPNTYDAVIVFGSINFGTYEDVSLRFKKVFELTAPGGRVYVRANPGESHKNGPWIEIYPWDFDSVYRIAKDHNVNLITLKKDNGNRLYFEFQK